MKNDDPGRLHSRDVRRLPAGALSTVFRLMERHNLMIQALVSTPRGPLFEMVPRHLLAPGIPLPEFHGNRPSSAPRR